MWSYHIRITDIFHNQYKNRQYTQAAGLFRCANFYYQMGTNSLFVQIIEKYTQKVFDYIAIF